MNILVTGGAGFIGSHFLNSLLKLPTVKKVVNLDCLSYGNNQFCLKSIESDKRYTFIKGNILNRDLIYSIFKKYDINKVIHFAAESHVDKSFEAIDFFLKTNVLGTQVLLESAKKAWHIKNNHGMCIYKEGTKFLHISTDEVYGPINSEQLYYKEDAPLNPTNPYATSKASADLVALAYRNNFNLPLNITRSTNNYGIFQFPDKLIPRMIIKGIKGECLPVYGQGQEIREWLHVEDHVSILLNILMNGTDGEIYNISSGIRKRNIEVVELIANILGLSRDKISFVKNRLCHDKAYGIDNQKLINQFGFKPKRDFKLELEKIVTWYSKNEKWWSDFI